MPIDPLGKAPSASVGVAKDEIMQRGMTKQSTAITFADRVEDGICTRISALASGAATMPGFLSGAAVIFAAAASQVGQGVTMMQTIARGSASGRGGMSGFDGIGGETAGTSLAEAHASTDTPALASNKRAVMGQRPTFTSILMDNGTSGGPIIGSINTAIGTQLRPPTGQSQSVLNSKAVQPVGSAGFGGLGNAGSAMSVIPALGVGGATVPCAAASAMSPGSIDSAADSSTGGDALASSATATGSGSQAQLLRGTQSVQEMQVAFNMQYLQLQNSMQSDKRQFTMVSNIMKTKHDTVKNTISNIH